MQRSGSTPPHPTSRKTAETIADKSYVNTDMDIILTMLGRYQNGLGKTWDDPDSHEVLQGRRGRTSLPVGRHVVPDPAQALGPAEEHPDYLAVAKQVNRIDIYKQPLPRRCRCPRATAAPPG
jgi:nitrate/nitrite transport system substrate-binding protein